MTAARQWYNLTIMVGILCSLVANDWSGLAEQAAPKSGDNQVQVKVYPVDLPTVLRLASANNLDIKIAREKLAEAKAVHAEAVAQFLPWLAPGVSYRRHENRLQDVTGNILDADKQAYSAGAALVAQVDMGAAIYQTLAARQAVKATDQALNSQKQDSSLAAVQGYFDLARSRSAIEVIGEALKISQDYQTQLRNAVQAGIAFKGDELRVQVQTEHYQVNLRQTLEQQRIAAARLAQVLHLDPAVELQAQDLDLVPLTLVPTNAALDSLVAQALTRRPELKQNQAMVAAASEAKKGVKYGPLIPTIGAQAYFGGLGGGIDNSTGHFGQTEDYLAFVGWRIGPGGLFDYSRIRASEARLAGTRLEAEKLRDDIIRQVVEHFTRVGSLSDQYATAKLSLSTAAEALKLTQARREYAVGIVLENIQAQQEFTRARNDFLNVVADYNKAQYALSKAIGGLTIP